MRAALLLLALAGCHAPGTWVLLHLDKTSAALEVESVDLLLSLSGEIANTTVSEKDGSPIHFPTTAVLAIEHGAGDLTIVGIARGANGREVARYTTTDAVTREHTVEMFLLFGDVSADLGSRPTDLAHGGAALSIDPFMHDFGSAVTGGIGSSFAFTVANSGAAASGVLEVTLSGASASDFQVTGANCVGQKLAPGGSCNGVVTFKPTSDGPKSASLWIRDGVGQAIATLSGEGFAPGSLTITPITGKQFGSQVLGAPSAGFDFTVENSGDTATGPLAVSLTGANAGDFMFSGCDGMSLAGHTHCQVTAAFTPLGTGARTASLLVMGAPGGAVTANLGGNGITAANLSFTMNAAHDFGLVSSGGFAPLSLEVTNQGGDTTGAIETTLGGDTAAFVVTDRCQGMQLASGKSCTLGVLFAASGHGARALTVSLSASPGGSAMTTLTGTARDTVGLTVGKDGSGSGTVSAPGGGAVSTGSGIDCGANCGDLYYRATSSPTVTLTATPAAGASVTGWSIPACATNPTCDVTLDADTSVTVTFTVPLYTLSLTNLSVAGKTGLVTSTSMPTPAAEINCGSACQVSLALGTVVTLAAAPSAGAYFGGWSGDCAGFSGCTFTMSGDRAVTARFTPANIVFVTAAQYTIPQIALLGSGSGEAKMLSGANTACATAANGKLGGHFEAWISGSAGALSRLKSSATGNPNPRGWLRTDGKPSVDDLAETSQPTYKMYYPPSFDESGVRHPVGHAVTGTESGNPLETCQAWTSSSPSDFAALGEIGASGWGWSRYTGVTCDDIVSKFSLYCFQTDYTAVVPPPTPPASRRRIFLTSSPWDPETGLAAADSLCGSLAAMRSYPGTYRAILPSTGSTAASRFTAHGLPVVRPDGAIVAATDTAMFAPGFVPDAMLDLNDSGSYAGPCQAFTGGFNDLATPGSDGQTCMSWTSPSATGGLGFPSIASRWLNGNFTATCSPQLHGLLYCLQE